MPDLTNNELAELVATELLPDVPPADAADSGYDWMERLAGTGWTPIAGDRHGNLLGDWPLQVVAHHDDTSRDLYGLAVYTEGDLRVVGYRTKAARNRETDQYLQQDD